MSIKSEYAEIWGDFMARLSALQARCPHDASQWRYENKDNPDRLLVCEDCSYAIRREPATVWAFRPEKDT